jgi:hypothetical protein
MAEAVGLLAKDKRRMTGKPAEQRNKKTRKPENE